MSTDRAWMEWGERDPYFAVITMPEFRKGSLDETARERFFEMGERHARYVIDMARLHVSADFKPRRVLDFGCGVGRVLLPLAKHAESAVGVDISPAMLEEAKLNAARWALPNVRLLQSDDSLSLVDGEFDLVHSAIVFQHIDVPRGRRLFQRLLELLAPGGIAAIQITYGKSKYADSFGVPPPEPSALDLPALDPVQPKSWFARWRGRSVDASAERAVTPPGRDPEMQMNPYSLSELAFMMQGAGIQKFHASFTDHGGELGVFMFFQRPALR